MNKKFFTVGPAELLDDIRQYYAEAIDKDLFSVSHRSSEFEEVSRSTINSLRDLLKIPDDFYVFFLSSATECMERIIQNLVEKKSFHFINGYFAQRFYNISQSLGKNPEFIKSDFGKDFNFDEAVIAEDTELICVTHNETSTGVVFDTNRIYDLKKKYPDAIIAVDVVTSLPYYSFDFSLIDTAFFSVQKGFGLPPGLGVMICRKNLTDKAKLLSEKGIITGSYNSFMKLALNADKYQTTMTPNIPAIFLLGKSCEWMLNKGLETIKNETEKKSNLIYSFFDNHPNIKPFVTDKHLRSFTTIVLETESDTEKIFKKLEYNDFIVSRGYGDYRNKHIRIGNFPVHRYENVSNLLYLFKKF